MKKRINSIQKSTYINGIIQAMMASLILALFMPLIIFNKMMFFSFPEIFNYFVICILWAFITTFTTLIIAIVLGVPTTYLLFKLGIENKYSTSVFGGVIGYIVSIAWLGFGYNPLQIIFFIYGIICGYAFMYGYQKEDKL